VSLNLEVTFPLNSLTSHPALDGHYGVGLEVGEHIPKEFEQMFLNNVTNMAIKDIVMSWAPPGQGGTGHVNLQEQSYVLEQMAQRGFCIDQEKTEKLRMAAEFKYFQKNLIALRRVP
jgi:hypothetical protein